MTGMKPRSRRRPAGDGHQPAGSAGSVGALAGPGGGTQWPCLAVAVALGSIAVLVGLTITVLAGPRPGPAPEPPATTRRLKQQLEADSATTLGSCESRFGKRLADGLPELEPRTRELVQHLKGWQESHGPVKVYGQPVDADQLVEIFERDGLSVRARDSLCKALEAYVKQVKSPTPNARRGLDAQLEVCYTVMFQASECASNLPSDNPRHVTSWQRRMLAGQAGLKIKAFGTNSEQSLRAAVAALFVGVCGREPCAKELAVDVRNVYFDLLSVMKMLNATADELEEVVAEARLLDGGAANWKDAHAIHTQLPGIRATPFWKPSDFPWLISELAARYADIQDELDGYLEFTGTGPFASQPGSARLEAGPKQWNSLVLTAADGNLCTQHFPVTCAAVGFGRRPALQRKNFAWPPQTPRGYEKQAPPGLQVHIYQLMPGGRVLPHRGEHCRLVAALGLRIPATGATITVGGETRQFREGEFVLFDDSWEHDVVNPSATESRYVLTTMLLHPECCRGCEAVRGGGV